MIIPAILEDSFGKIVEKISICKPFSNTIHIDFIDSSFSTHQTFLDSSSFSKYSNDLFLEAHLMVEDPFSFLDPLASAGFKRFIGQIETMQNQDEFVAKGKELGEVGLALDLDTNLEQIKVDINQLDQILLMTVKAGESGQEFDERVLVKIENLKSMGYSNIEVDGGINRETIVLAKNAGASVFCVNSFLFNGGVRQNYNLLTSLIS